MTRDVRCSGCQAAVEPVNIDWERELATCSRCGRLIDLRKARPVPAVAPPEPGAARARSRVQLPSGMSMTTTADQLVIRRRWLRRKHWFLLCIIGGAAIYVAYLWATLGASAWLVVGTLFVLSWNYNLATVFLNSTVVAASPTSVKVQHGPLPSLFARNAAVEKHGVEQFYSAKHGAHFAVLAKLKSGEPFRLVAPLVTAEQALFVEQRLEKALGLADFAVEGELGSEELRVDGKPASGAASGAVLALVIPVFVIATVGLFLFAATAEVSGRLQASGVLGSWTFEPDDCDSGQHEGFGGVILKSSSGGGRQVRIVRDPVRGNLVVVAAPGKPNHVISSESCPRLVINVRRGNTNINDVWAQEGNATLECAELSGSVKFEGCH
jgi:hypothetical protein